MTTFSFEEYQLTPAKSALDGAVAFATSTIGGSATDVLMLSPLVISIDVGLTPVTFTGSSPIAVPQASDAARTATTDEPTATAVSLPLSSTEITSFVTIQL